MQAYWTMRYNAVTIAMLARIANGKLRCGLAVSPLAMGPFSRPKNAKSTTDIVVVKFARWCGANVERRPGKENCGEGERNEQGNLGDSQRRAHPSRLPDARQQQRRNPTDHKTHECDSS